MVEFIQLNGPGLIDKLIEHFTVSMVALFLGVLVAVPLGIIIVRNKRVAQIVVSICSILQTIPSLALLAIMVPLFGVGKTPAILALFIYSLLPILRNTYLGMMSVDKNLLDAAKGMGMTPTQVILRVQLPLALQVIMSGIRLSAVYVIGWATIASYVGAGGLGDYIFAGMNNFNFSLLISATVLVTLLALGTDFLLAKCEVKLTPTVLKRKQVG